MTEKLFLVKYFFNSVKTFAHTFPPHIPQSELILLQIKLLQIFADADIKWQSRDVDTRSLRCIIIKIEQTTSNALRFKSDHDTKCCFSPLS